MLKNHFKIAWRNFYKQPFYTGINVFGLALGIGCSLILYLFISYHLSFDRYHHQEERIFKTVTNLHVPDGSIDYDQGAPYVLGELLKQFPAVASQTTLIGKRSFTVAVPQKNAAEQSLFYEPENIAFADHNWFKLFTYGWKSGNPKAALTDPYTAVITSALAKKYFNTDAVVGKTLRIENKYTFTINGVLQDIPGNTDVRENLFLSMPSAKLMFPDPAEFWTGIDFISSKVYVFVQLKNELAQKQVDNGIARLLKKDFKASGALEFKLQPLADIHFNNRYAGKISRPLLMILAVIGFALILIACVNFINLATAQSLTRTKEIGTRRVLGSSKGAIFWQFILETSFVTFAAGLIALLITMLFLPVLNQWLQTGLQIDVKSVIFLSGVLLLVVFAAGFYPAVMLSSFKPVDALKSKISSSKNAVGISRDVLIVLQNVIAQTLIVCTVIIVLQVKFLRNVDLGFDKDAVVMVPMPDHDAVKQHYFRNQLSSNPGIKSLSFCYKPPSAATQKGGSIKFDGHEWEKYTVSSIIGDQNYIKTFGLKLIAGRDFYATDTANVYIVNQQVLKQLHLKNPEQAVGHKIVAGDFNDQTGTIIGVVKDFNIHPLNDPLLPALIAPKPENYDFAAIKISGGHQQNLLKNIELNWKKTFPENAYEYHFLDEQLTAFYQKEETISKLIAVGTVVAILISCLGLLGLISLMTLKRTKEIGVRKVLGATVNQVVALLTADFVRLLVLAILISTPFAWWAMHAWLENFAYRVTISWWIFGLTGVLTLTIALLTISFQAVKAALANPVKSLRSE